MDDIFILIFTSMIFLIRRNLNGNDHGRENTGKSFR